MQGLQESDSQGLGASEQGTFPTTVLGMANRVHANVDFINVVAARLHEAWRRGYQSNPQNRNTDGVIKPREKPTTDTEWSRRHSGATTVNIDAPYADLPSDWQRDNRLAAEHAIPIVTKALQKETDQAGQETAETVDIESIADQVHNDWMRRTPREQWNEHLFVPYAQLPDDEKKKDRDLVQTVIDALATM